MNIPALVLDLAAGISALLYLLYLWLQLRNISNDSFTKHQVAALIVPAIVVHLIYASLLFRVSDGYSLTIWSSAVAVTWVAVVTTFYLHLSQGFRVLALIVVPITIVILVLSNILSPLQESPISDPGVFVHVMLSLFAYGILALAAIQAVAILVLHRSLKKHDSTTFIQLMPPLQTVESTSMQLLWLGTALLTLSITTGFTLLWQTLQNENYWLHMGLAVSCWAIYLALLCGQLWFGWRGQISARLSVSAFCVLFLGYMGLSIVFDYGT